MKENGIKKKQFFWLQSHSEAHGACARRVAIDVFMGFILPYIRGGWACVQDEWSTCEEDDMMCEAVQ